MKRYILFTMALFFIIAFRPIPAERELVKHEFNQQYGDYVTFTNDRHYAVTLTIWYCENDTWQVIHRIHLPSYYTTTVGHQRGMRYKYGYSVSGDREISKIYNDHVRIY